MQYRGTYIQVDLNAIAENTALLRAAIAPAPHMMAVVKANAYGHGLVPVAQTALKNGADWLGVAIPEEGEFPFASMEAKSSSSPAIRGFTARERVRRRAEF